MKLLDDEVGTREELAEMLRAQLISAGADVVVGLPADDSAANPTGRVIGLSVRKRL